MENKIKILSTARLPAALVAEAAEENIAITVIPFIETEPIRSVEVQQEIESAFLQSAIVVFTSQNAVKAVAEEAEGQDPDWIIYCVGEKTAQLAGQTFGEGKVQGTAQNAAELAELLLETEESIDEIIFFCGAQRRTELPDILEEHGVYVNEIIVYETVAVPHKADAGYAGILFFSPSAADSYFSVNKAGSNQVFFATGATTAAAIRKYTGNIIITCQKTGKDEMVKEVMIFFEHKRDITNE